MDRLPPDATKLLEAWMEWERGETPPGRVMSNLKTAGLRELLEEIVAHTAPGSVTATASSPEERAPSAEAWTPVV